MQCACVILSSVACPAVQYVFHDLINSTILGGEKKRLSKNCVLISTNNFVRKISHSKKNSGRCNHKST